MEDLVLTKNDLKLDDLGAVLRDRHLEAEEQMMCHAVP